MGCEAMTENNGNNSFCIRLADMVVRIEPMFDYIKVYCQGYVTEEKEDFSIRIKQTDIDFERKHSKKDAEREGRDAYLYSDAYLETLAVYRQIAERLPMSNIVLFHGSVIAVDGIGYLFTAKSGTGKSTHTRLWREQFGSRAVMVNDDKPLLKITDSGVIAYGTPWNGKHRLSTNIAVPLNAVCVLTRDKENHIMEILPRDAYLMLLQQTYRPMDGTSMVQTMKLIDGMMKNTRFYRLGCNMESESARVAYEGMNREK
jgi:hypothetical protein